MGEAVTLKKLITKIVPYQCLFCLRLTERMNLCGKCKKRLPWLLQPVCKWCAIPLNNHQQPYCGQCLLDPPYFDQTICLFQYRPPINHLILSLKYHQQLQYIQLLTQLMIQKIQTCHTLPELIISVPLHAKRLQQRGFNQATELAKPLAKKLNIPFNQSLIKRQINTVSQTQLQGKARLLNVRNAFMLNHSFNAKHIAIIDDVFTTGSTVNEISQLLKQHHAEVVDIWCYARTTHHKKEIT